MIIISEQPVVVNCIAKYSEGVIEITYSDGTTVYYNV